MQMSYMQLYLFCVSKIFIVTLKITLKYNLVNVNAT